MGKTLLVYNMNLKEMENYEEIYADIGKTSSWCVCVTVLDVIITICSVT